MLERLHLDRNLFYALLALSFLSLMVVYSAAAKDNAVALGHIGRLALGFVVLVVLAQVRPENLERWSPYIFGAGPHPAGAGAHHGHHGQGVRRAGSTSASSSSSPRK